MYGAIIGVIIGSPFEFDRGDKTKNFILFTKGCKFTDDSVMTVAVADALIMVGSDASEIEIKCAVTEKMRHWGRRYPHAGYGGRFRHWLKDRNPKPYNSFGNGSAMRVSPVGWAFDTLEETLEAAKQSAEVTHNHPEGIKGAQATAACIFLARTGKSKEEIKDYIEKTFGYNLSRTCDEIRPSYKFDESCQGTVPESIIAFLDSTDFESAVRLAISLGGDADTMGAITGSIAEAYYGIPAELREEIMDYLDDFQISILEEFESLIR